MQPLPKFIKNILNKHFIFSIISLFIFIVNPHIPVCLPKSRMRSASACPSSLIFSRIPGSGSCPRSQDVTAHLKSRCISRISAPADARNVVRFSIRPVDGDQKICDFPAKWSFPVHRRFAYVSVQENGIALHIFIVIFHKFHLSGKHREHQPVFLFLMAVVGAELPPSHGYLLPFDNPRYIHKPLGDHDRDPVLGIAEPFDQHIYHIKAFAEYLMAECKPGYNFSHDFHLIVFNNLICHDCSSPSSFLYFV